MSEPKSTAKLERVPDFRDYYSNTSQFELSSFDLRIFFGTSQYNAATQQLASVRMTWAQAKVFHFFLGANLTIHETVNGKVKIPADALPQKPPTGDENNPLQKAAFELVAKMHEEFIADLDK